jgi:hypothetical protein
MLSDSFVFNLKKKSKFHQMTMQESRERDLMNLCSRLQEEQKYCNQFIILTKSIINIKCEIVKAIRILKIGKISVWHDGIIQIVIGETLQIEEIQSDWNSQQKATKFSNLSDLTSLSIK